MRVVMSIGATGIVLSLAVLSAGAQSKRTDVRMNLRINAIPWGSWANPHFETHHFSVAGEGALGPVGDPVTPDDALRGRGATYVFLPATETRDTADLPEAPIAGSAKANAPPRIADAGASCQSGVTVGTGSGFCVIN